MSRQSNTNPNPAASAPMGSPAALMQAAQYDRYGAADVLHVTQMERPIPKPDQLLVQVSAASVNGYDVLVRSGALKMATSRHFPKQTGLDFVGYVVDSPSGSSVFQVGDRVWGVMPLHELTAMAEYVAIHPQYVSRCPATLNDDEAAALPVVGATALGALRDEARLQPRERVLVRGASGGVGSIAVQLAKRWGAHVVGLAGVANQDFVRSLGADEVFDYAKTSPSQLGRFDVILDTVGSQPAIWRRQLRPGGRMVTLVPDIQQPILSLLYFTFSRVYGEQRVRYYNAKPDTDLLSELARQADGGQIKPIIHRAYALDQIGEAHRAFEQTKQPGKQIIALNRG